MAEYSRVVAASSVLAILRVSTEATAQALEEATTSSAAGWNAPVPGCTIIITNQSIGQIIYSNVTGDVLFVWNESSIHYSWFGFLCGSGTATNGTYTGSSTDVESNWTGQEITISNVGTGGQAFDWSSTLTVSQVVSKEGSSEFVSTTGLPGTSGSVADGIY